MWLLPRRNYLEPLSLQTYLSGLSIIIFKIYKNRKEYHKRITALTNEFASWFGILGVLTIVNLYIDYRGLKKETNVRHCSFLNYRFHKQNTSLNHKLEKCFSFSKGDLKNLLIKCKIHKFCRNSSKMLKIFTQFYQMVLLAAIWWVLILLAWK